MSERGVASALHDESPVSGDQPTLAATADQQAAGSSGARLRSPNDWSGREVAGRYVIIELLGEGGMGVVYVAEHLHLKKRVAFKIIHPDLAAHPELLLRFKREALATGQLDHPHIAAAIDFGELEGGGAFMVMPLVRGRSLQAEIEAAGKMEYRRAARLASQIADALSAAHAVGIVHRDLKPDNVLVERRSDDSEAAKVLDFGVASLAGRPEGLSVEARPLTQAGTILGTPGYMSPEQATAGEVDHRTDLYALGVMLWEMCRGERLFGGDDITQIFAKQFKSLPPALELGLTLPGRELSALVTRLLAWDKNERPGSAAEVRDTLRRISELPDSSMPQLSLPDLRKYAAYLPVASEYLNKYRHYQKHALIALGVLLVLAMFALRDDAASTPQTAVPIASEAVDKPATRAEKAAARRLEKEKAEREAAEREAEAKKAAQPEAPESSEALEDAEQTLLRGSRSRDVRRAAAKRVLRSDGEAARWLALVAELEMTDRCAEKKTVVSEMRELGDPRVLPVLERLAEQPRRGCGLLKLSDCLACMRRELDQTIGVIENN
jgi:eukaryotic-like serine/threonine-protein kinase